MVATLMVSVSMMAMSDRDVTRLWNAICWVESKGDPRAVKADENAVGIAQIRPIYLNDCNRIVGYQKWKPSDRTDPSKSFEMFVTHARHYAPNGTMEDWARIHNGGAKGNKKASTIAYWHRVQIAMKAR